MSRLLKLAIGYMWMIRFRVPLFVREDEHIARFILSESRIRKNAGEVRREEFRPLRNGKYSIYRCLADDSILWGVADRFVGRLRGKPVIAKAILVAQEIRDLKLEILPYPVPHYLHGHIVKWPAEKDEQKLIAIELASKANLVMRTP